ncbi:MAG: translation initiation factor IF-2, partial [Candidatus Aenigmatarchaeota archaeon]
PGEGKGTVLEVKEFKGLGLTIDVILYDGEIRKGDWLVIGGREAVKSRVKALMEPWPLKELRVEKSFLHVNSVSAAAGVKIAAPVIPGSPVRSVQSEKDVARAVEEVKEEVEEVEFESEKEGAILKADTLGSLEALIKSLKPLLPIRKAEVGNVARADIMAVKSFKEPKIFAFGLKVPPDMETLAKDNKVKIFSSEVIYSLIEEFQTWEKEKKKREEEAMLERVTRPGRVKALPGFVFRQKKPAVFGVEVLKGTIRPGYRLAKAGKVVGEVKEVQKEGEGIEEAVMGDKVAVSMPEVTIGKEVKEGDVLDVFLTGEARQLLEKIRKKLREDELELLEEQEAE